MPYYTRTQLVQFKAVCIALQELEGGTHTTSNEWNRYPTTTELADAVGIARPALYRLPARPDLFNKINNGWRLTEKGRLVALDKLSLANEMTETSATMVRASTAIATELGDIIATAPEPNITVLNSSVANSCTVEFTKPDEFSEDFQRFVKFYKWRDGRDVVLADVKRDILLLVGIMHQAELSGKLAATQTISADVLVLVPDNNER